MNLRSLSFLVFLAALTIASGINATPAQDGSPTAPISPAPTQGPEKKVWTNDDLRDLRTDAPNSTLVERNAAPAKSPQRLVTPKGRNANWYHDQIAKLQARIPLLDSQISQLQSAIDGKPTGNGATSQRPRSVRVDDWSVELKQFQAQRDDVVSKISALEDQARHDGIPQKALP